MDGQITYRALIEHHTAALEREGKAPRTIGNRVWHLRRLMEAYSCQEGDPVGPELNGNFEPARDRLVAQAARSDRRARRSALNAWAAAYKSLLDRKGLPVRFNEALRYLVEREGVSYSELARELDVYDSMIGRWVKGKDHPKRTQKNHERIYQLEKFFGLERGTLIEKLGYRGQRQQKRVQSQFGRYISSLQEDGGQKYGFSEAELPPRLRDDLAKLVAFKTRAVLPKGMKRNKVWRLKDEQEYGRSVYNLARIEGQVCTSAQIYINIALRFFGFLVSEKSYQPSELSLGQFADSALQQDFAYFLKKRRGAYTRTGLDAVERSIALLHPEWGYITQMPSLGQRLDPPVPENEWAEWCAEHRQETLRFVKELEKSGQVKKGRDPREPIAQILDDPAPARWLYELERRMHEDERTTPMAFNNWAKACRDRLLIRFLISNPLRLNHFKTMTWREDNTGHLRRHPDGRWILRFEPHEFKNEKGAAKERYSVKVNDWVADLLEDYLEKVRPHLPGAAEADYLFLRTSHTGSWSKSAARKHLISALDLVVSELTSRYLPDIAPMGFRTHAFRHIIATDYLKQNPGAYHMVAKILHDKLETVLNEYGHLEAGDGLAALEKSHEKYINGGNGRREEVA